MDFIIWEDVLIVSLMEEDYLWEDIQSIQGIGKKIKYMEKGDYKELMLVLKVYLRVGNYEKVGFFLKYIKRKE